MHVSPRSAPNFASRRGRWAIATTAVAIAIGAVAGAATLLAGARPQRNQFRSVTEVVVVDALVTRRGQPVTGLTDADFDVFDSGVRQSPHVQATEAPIDLLLALDTSGSLTGAPLEHLKDAATAIVATIGPADRAALLTFSYNVARPTPWTADQTEINRAIAAMTGHGQTSLFDALFTALTLTTDSDRRALVLLLTDGEDTSSWLSPKEILDAAPHSAAVVYSVSVGADQRPASPLGPEDLRHRLMDQPSVSRNGLVPVLVHDTGGEMVHAARSEDLRDRFLEVMARFRKRYLLSYAPTGVAKQGWHPIDVRVRGTDVQVSAKRGYQR